MGNIVSLLDVYSICVAMEELRFCTRHTTVISVELNLFETYIELVMNLWRTCTV